MPTRISFASASGMVCFVVRDNNPAFQCGPAQDCQVIDSVESRGLRSLEIDRRFVPSHGAHEMQAQVVVRLVANGNA